MSFQSDTIQRFTTGGAVPLALQLTPSTALPSVAPSAAFIRRIGSPHTVQPWDPRITPPPGYELVPANVAGTSRRAIAGGRFTPDARALDFSVTAASSLSSDQAEARRQRTTAAAAARAENAAQKKAKARARADARLIAAELRGDSTPTSTGARPPRVPRRPRPARRSRRPRVPRETRAERQARNPRPSRPAVKPAARVQGFCKSSDDTGGCWNIGTCGPSPIGGAGTFGHCIYNNADDCSACQTSTCSKHGTGLIQSMLRQLPASWRADPAHEEIARTQIAKRRERNRVRATRLPPLIAPGFRSSFPTTPVTLVPHSTGCPHGSGLCCGLTGFRCNPPGVFCGACTDAQRRAYALMAGG